LKKRIPFSSKKEGADYLETFGLTDFGKEAEGLLFNLKEDPRQSTNLYAEHPEKVEQMRALQKRYTGGERCAPSR
jgi:hypothetical protein